MFKYHLRRPFREILVCFEESLGCWFDSIFWCSKINLCATWVSKIPSHLILCLLKSMEQSSVISWKILRTLFSLNNFYKCFIYWTKLSFCQIYFASIYYINLFFIRNLLYRCLVTWIRQRMPNLLISRAASQSTPIIGLLLSFIIISAMMSKSFSLSIRFILNGWLFISAELVPSILF